jgi:hypothetical protein
MDSKLFEHIFRDGEHFDEHFIKHIDTYADKHPAGVVKQLATRLRKAWQDLEQAKKDAALVRARALDEIRAQMRPIGWMRPEGTIHKGLPPEAEPAGWEPIFAAESLT